MAYKLTDEQREELRDTINIIVRKDAEWQRNLALRRAARKAGSGDLRHYDALDKNLWDELTHIIMCNWWRLCRCAAENLEMDFNALWDAAYAEAQEESDAK